MFTLNQYQSIIYFEFTFKVRRWFSRMSIICPDVKRFVTLKRIMLVSYNNPLNHGLLQFC